MRSLPMPIGRRITRMTVYVQGLSALAHYRSASAQTEAERCPTSVAALKEATSSLAACIDAGIWRLGIGEPTPKHPLEVLVRERAQRSRSKSVIARVWGKPIARTAFRRVSNDIYVSSPEFLFLQMATRLDLPELAALGMELCGTYRRKVEVPLLGTNETGSMTAYHQQPLSTPKRLSGFLSSMRSSPGYARAQKALSYVLPNSASPLETALYLLLCLPRRVGGYALPKPTLNPHIVLSRAGRMHTLRRSAKPDLYWKALHLDLEYNSDEFHDENQRALDSMRRKAFERMKVEVIELTKEELFSTSLFHATVLRIAQRCGKQLRPQDEGDFSEKRASLRNRLLIEESSESTAGKADSGKSDIGTAVESFSQDSDADLVEFDDNAWADELLDDDWWIDMTPDLDETWDYEGEKWDEEGLHVFGGRIGKDSET